MNNSSIGASIGLVIVIVIFGAFPIGTEIIESEAKIGIGDKWEQFTLTGYTYMGAGSIVSPRVYTLIFTTNGRDYSFSFEDVPSFVTLQGLNFTIIDYDNVGRNIEVVSGHPKIRKITFLGLLNEMVKETGRRSGADTT